MSESASELPGPPPTGQYKWPYVLRLWFGVTEPVHRLAYALSGFGLMLLKYGVEALLTWTYTKTFLTPLDFLNPVLNNRAPVLQAGPAWLPWTLFLWTLPFVWIAITMSVRRMADCGNSPWHGLFVLVPLINLFLMISLCFAPSAPRNPWLPVERAPSEGERPLNAAFAIGLSLMVGGVMLWVSVYLFSTYGASLFIGTPMLMGTTASYLYNRNCSRSYRASVGVGVSSVLFALCALLLFALEGVICLAMAAPLVIPLGILGGLLGKAIADATRRPKIELMAAIAVLPLWAVLESYWMHSPEFVVLSSVDINASPNVVWNNIVEFPELTEPPPWYFSWGIACPQRARIVGTGVGATRYCEFTTGTFVEPITVWKAPRQLTFAVADQPDALVELSPYRNVRPPHLKHSLRSTRGQFQLIPLEGGGTRLEGQTWYKFDMFPQWYWTLWSDVFIHQIHLRVLEHIKTLSEHETTTVAARAN